MNDKRLRLRFIEQKAKTVNKSSSWTDRANALSNPEYQIALLEIIRMIEAGHRIPDRFYRKNRDTTPDRLLEEEGVMHLHLGHPNTREIVFIIQYSSSVLLLEIADHYYFSCEPPGTVLMQLHSTKIEQYEDSLERAAEAMKKAIRKSIFKEKAK